MPMEYHSRNAVLTAVDTLATIGDVVSTASGAIQVPANAKRIAQIGVAFAGDSAVVGAASILVRLSGNGMVPAQHDLAGGAVGGQLATSGSQPTPTVVWDTDIKVVPNNQITVSASMNEVDVGSIPIIITLGFEVS